ncbi:hypothetical protein FBY30_2745 [Arthrobacter sp. SLBN-83]|uniref:hypothetical protein n=1 Tax=Arthrobacter sp. SLBN-83 TaxID=2768449 RepID=UPI00114FB450|nr:hypothetical protein [Arthrobacter sp. SLBN-83]TQJ60477.1 hypothetical protein FBY30_2745 [Arthrobacter sp. SLBN-83]
MANIVFGAPHIPPVDPAPAWSGMPMTWTAKGVTWPLTDRSTGIYLRPNVRGLGTITTERHASTSPALPGSRHEGVSVLDREVTWPIRIYCPDGSVAWMLRDRAFWEGMDPEDTGIWEVTHPDGAKRSLRLRFRDDSDHLRKKNPLKLGWDEYSINLVAEQPYWVGEPEVQSFKAPPPPQPFFEPNGPALVNIASSYSVENATIDNLGDVESCARWYIDGETTSASVGVNGVVVTVPFTVPYGQCLVIESDPENLGATLYDITVGGMNKKPSERIFGEDLINPVDKTRDLGENDFAPIPAGKQVPLSLTLVGTGVVECLLPSLYRRPW